MGRIALIAGVQEQIDVLTVFAQFAKNHEIRVHAFDGTTTEHLRRCGFGFTLYELDANRPGYMAGLEEQIAQADLIIAAGPENLSSFQALRLALRDGKKFHCIVFDRTPSLYDDFMNIRAIRHDILTRSDVLWATGQSAVETILFDGADPGRVRQIPFLVDPTCFPMDESRRARFRSHVGIAPDSRVVLYRGQLDKKGPAGELVKSLHALRLRNTPGFSELVVIFSGLREEAESLKYMVSDWQLSSHVRFLHQDPQSFLADLLNAVDMTIDGTDDRTSRHELFAGVAGLYGAIPVLTSSQRSSKWLGAHGYEVADLSSLTLARLLQTVLSDPMRVDKMGTSIREALIPSVDFIKEAQSSDGFVGWVEGCLHLTGDIAADGSSVPDALDLKIDEIERNAGAVPATDSIFAIEDFLLCKPEPDLRARALFCKGNVLFTSGNYESATDSYREALLQIGQTRDIETSVQARTVVSNCYRGLGNIAAAVQSHQEALDLYRRALALNPQDSMTCSGIGNVYRRLRLYEESLHWLSKAVITKPDDEFALKHFSQAVLECPEKDLAAGALAGVVQVVGEHPSLERAMNNLGIDSDAS